MTLCGTCSSYYFGDKHTCAPRWRVWVHDYHEVGNDSDSWEYVERETFVFVRRLDTGEARWIKVYGEPSIHWSTDEADPPEGFETVAPDAEGEEADDVE